MSKTQNFRNEERGLSRNGRVRKREEEERRKEKEKAFGLLLFFFSENEKESTEDEKRSRVCETTLRPLVEKKPKKRTLFFSLFQSPPCSIEALAAFSLSPILTFLKRSLREERALERCGGELRGRRGKTERTQPLSLLRKRKRRASRASAFFILLKLLPSFTSSCPLSLPTKKMAFAIASPARLAARTSAAAPRRGSALVVRASASEPVDRRAVLGAGLAGKGGIGKLMEEKGSEKEEEKKKFDGSGSFRNRIGFATVAKLAFGSFLPQRARFLSKGRERGCLAIEIQRRLARMPRRGKTFDRATREATRHERERERQRPRIICRPAPASPDALCAAARSAFCAQKQHRIDLCFADAADCPRRAHTEEEKAATFFRSTTLLFSGLLGLYLFLLETQPQPQPLNLSQLFKQPSPPSPPRPPTPSRSPRRPRPAPPSAAGRSLPPPRARREFFFVSTFFPDFFPLVPSCLRRRSFACSFFLSFFLLPAHSFLFLFLSNT